MAYRFRYVRRVTSYSWLQARDWITTACICLNSDVI